ncbi:MAG: helix-turn-helix domain-containing protein [Alphaproteobacteria bacterium]|nr:helix-turn-helix domain-containing protein [Alphaproteobacteria bacterium]
MIGLYIQNKYTQDTLVRLLAHKNVGPYQPDKTYDFVIWLSDLPHPNINCPLVDKKDLSLPLSLSGWEQILNKYQNKPQSFENKTFFFDGASRKIINKTTHKEIVLTEKESELVCFLIKAPHHKATKEQILQMVWLYNPEAQTHTIESHIYSIRQKLMPDADLFIQSQGGLFYLI